MSEIVTLSTADQSRPPSRRRGGGSAVGRKIMRCGCTRSHASDPLRSPVNSCQRPGQVAKVGQGTGSLHLLQLSPTAAKRLDELRRSIAVDPRSLVGVSDPCVWGLALVECRGACSGCSLRLAVAARWLGVRLFWFWGCVCLVVGVGCVLL